MAAIEVRDLTKAYGDVVANDSLSFEVETGEIFGYLGPNGAGKTTTIRTLMGFQSPTSGTARVLGSDVRDEQALIEAKADLGYLPGDPEFDESVTGREFLDFQARLKGDERREEMLTMFDPPLDRKIREYSTGNKQMLGIVQAFMHDPDLVLMDEPTSGLDPLKQEAFNSFLRQEREAGKTIFFSSHVLGEVRRVCDRVGIIRNGRLVALEDISSLLSRGGKRVTVHTRDSLSASDLDTEGVVDPTNLDDGVAFTFAGDYNDLLAILSDYVIVDLEIEEPPLEDVFMHFYGEAEAGAETDGARGGDGRDAAAPPAEGGGGLTNGSGGDEPDGSGGGESTRGAEHGRTETDGGTDGRGGVAESGDERREGTDA
ncbi:MAG: ABC transporter ATP-binding protein [Haloferacaceae archaeon]